MKLTQMQSQLWAVQQLFPDRPLYNTAWRFNLPMVDPDRFALAFQALAERADALRMTVVASDETPRFALGAAVAGPHTHVEFIDCDAMDRDMRARLSRPLELSTTTVESVLYTLDDNRSVWFLNLHHIINDGLSGLILFREMAKIYESFASGDALGAENLPSFASHLTGADGLAREKDRQFWEEWCRNAPAVPRLYGKELSGTRAEAAERRVTLSQGQLAQLDRLIKTPGFASLSRHQTIFTIFETALSAWVHRVSGEDDIVIGIATHGRPTPVQRRTAGCFVDLFPLDITVSAEDSFESLHGRLRARNKACLQHASPGSFQAKGISRFSVVLNAFPVSFPDFAGAATDATWLGNGCTDPTHALRLNVLDGGAEGGLTLKFLFNAEVVDEAHADTAVAHVMRLVEAMLEDPASKIQDVALAQAHEASFQLAHAALEPAPPAEDVVAAVWRHAAEDPDALSVRDDDRNWRRGALCARANAIAEMLARSGVGAGARVGIHLRRGGDLVASVLAVLHRGASFVPLDPGQPTGRLDLIAAEAELSAVISEAPLRRAWAGTPACIRLEDVPLSAPTTAPCASPGPAYILFTSGSTGRPKGVEVGREALARYAAWAQKTHGGRPEASWALHSAIGFDLTLSSIFAPLVGGGHLRAYREDPVGPDLAVLRVFEDDAVDVVKLTPRHLELALSAPRALRRVRTLVLGGEELTVGLARQAQASFGSHLAVHNEYGPTEAVVGCMNHIFDPQTDQGATVPIGHAAAATQITVRDAALNPVPDGTIGEIYVAGQDRLAEGYFRNPIATEARFVSAPESGVRMYRTGDLGSVGQDGTIRYHGRRDQQLKVSGIRIEPAEIADAVSAVAGVRGCLVDLFDPMARPERHCTSCGISDRVPEVPFNDAGLCQLCQDFERYQARAASYFRSPQDLQALIDDAAAQKTGAYDCVAMLSGGKDSTYAVARLAEMTPNILCVTLDNGYIAEEAKENIRRVTEALGLDHRFLRTDAMKSIFVDSLKRHANVCQGCFKTIYTLSLRVAREVGAPMIVTGLSRGQLFETRLAPELFKDHGPAANSIDDIVLAARRNYHALPDTVTQALNGDLFERGDILGEVAFVDFYRYVDVPISEVYRYLEGEVGWRRPSDTGRSTNCLINDVGIYLHKAQRRHHNYALPYSWDVRMGHKTVEQCLDELNDEIDEARVKEILDEIGYDGAVDPTPAAQLTCYYEADAVVTPEQLRRAVSARLPQAVIPSHFVRLDRMPLTVNGKVDRTKLPAPGKSDARSFATTAAKVPEAASALEATLLGLWQATLQAPDLQLTDNFYDVGGNSIRAIQIAARAQAEGIDISPIDIFRAQSIRALAAICEETEPKAPAEPKRRAEIADGDKAALAALLMGAGNG